MSAPAALRTFTFAENEGPLSMEFDFSNILAEGTRLDDYALHAHFKVKIEDGGREFAATSADGSFAITDADLHLAEITIPTEVVEGSFPGCGVWPFDILMVEVVSGLRINAGLYNLAIVKAVTRGVE